MQLEKTCPRLIFSLQEECLKCLKSGDTLASYCFLFVLLEKLLAGTNLDKISV